MTPNQQMRLPFPDDGIVHDQKFTSTRFLGSKRKFAIWIWNSIKHLDFTSVLDVFGGTGAVSYKLKSEGKQVTYNDKLKFNWLIGTALIQNGNVTLTSEDVEIILTRTSDSYQPGFIQATFKDIYYYDDENAWLDTVIHNIRYGIANPLKQALAYFALFQACIVKRPYNLFHRANLYMREADVERSFGNKVTWDTPFETHFRAFATEANTAVFDNGFTNLALNLDALETPTGADLVYLDPPYLNANGTGVDYRDFYHFLEGIAHYESWADMIDQSSKHRRLKPEKSAWLKPKTMLAAFEDVIALHRNSILVLSYRDDGIPTKEQLGTLLKKYKSRIEEAHQPTSYALSTRDSREILLIAY